MAAQKMTVQQAADKAKADLAKKKAEERAKALKKQQELDKKPSAPMYGDSLPEKAIEKGVSFVEDIAGRVANSPKRALNTAGSLLGRIPLVKRGVDAFAKGAEQFGTGVGEAAAGRPMESVKVLAGVKSKPNSNIVGQVAEGLFMGKEAQKAVRGKLSNADTAAIAAMLLGGKAIEAIVAKGFTKAEIAAAKESKIFADAAKKAAGVSKNPASISQSSRAAAKAENKVSKEEALQAWNELVHKRADYQTGSIGTASPGTISEVQKVADKAGANLEILPAVNKTKRVQYEGASQTYPDSDVIIKPKPAETTTASKIRGEGYNGKPAADAERFTANVPETRARIETKPLEYNGEIPYKKFKKLQEINTNLGDARNRLNELKDELDSIKGNTSRRQELLGDGEDGIIPVLEKQIKIISAGLRDAQTAPKEKTAQEVIDAWDSLLKHQGYRRKLAETGRTDKLPVNKKTWEVEQNPNEPLPTDTMEADIRASEIAGDKGGLGLTEPQMENVKKRMESVDKGVKLGSLNRNTRSAQLKQMVDDGYILSVKDKAEAAAIRNGTWEPKMAKRTKAELAAQEEARTARQGKKALDALNMESMATRGRILQDKLAANGKLTQAERRELSAIKNRTWTPTTDWTKPVNPPKTPRASTTPKAPRAPRKPKNPTKMDLETKPDDSFSTAMLKAMLRGEW